MNESKNLWGGRFTGRADERFVEFNRSFGFDRRLFEADVRASLAHCAGLFGAGVLTSAEAERIKNGLQTILKRARTDARYFDELPSEDVHSFVEARLVQLVGDTGRKLHTGRSRNDHAAIARCRTHDRDGPRDSLLGHVEVMNGQKSGYPRFCVVRNWRLRH